MENVFCGHDAVALGHYATAIWAFLCKIWGQTPQNVKDAVIQAIVAALMQQFGNLIQSCGKRVTRWLESKKGNPQE